MKICAWNTENFFVFMDKYKDENIDDLTNEQWEKLSCSTNTRNKHLQKVIDSAKVINDIDADIFVLTEMGGKESLNNFNKYFLTEDKYKFSLKAGNSNRGIEIGFLIKKDLELRVEVYSNKDLVLDNGSKFSRNIAELRAYNKENELKFILLGVHLKSKQHGKGDFEGISQRTKELIKLKSHIESLKDELKVPVIVAGDFNCSMFDNELQEFSTNLFEFHALKNSDEKESCTYVNFRNGKVMSQIDFIFSTDEIFDLDESFTYRFKNEYGDNMGIPDSFEEKRFLPSDHFPLVTVIKI